MRSRTSNSAIVRAKKEETHYGNVAIGNLAIFLGLARRDNQSSFTRPLVFGTSNYSESWDIRAANNGQAAAQRRVPSQ